MWERQITDFELSLDGGRSWCEASVPGCWETTTFDKMWQGPVWYRAAFELEWPEEHRCWRLWFERVSYFCEVFLNGVKLGEHEGMWDGFALETFGALRSGRNELSLKVVKPGYDAGARFPYRQALAGFIPDTGSCFGGVWGAVRLLGDGGARVRSPRLDAGQLSFEIEGGEASVEAYLEEAGQERLVGCFHGAAGAMARLELPASLAPWSPERPARYPVRFRVVNRWGEVHEQRAFMGVRACRAEGAALYVGGERVCLRGVLNWGWRPEIAPYATREEAAGQLEALRELGFNLVKCCLYLPSLAYLEEADRLGMMLWVELPLWLPEMNEATRARIRAQYPRLLEMLSNHPSVTLVTLGCELNASVESGLLEELYVLARRMMPGALVRDNSGSGECYGGHQQDFADFYDYHFYCELHQLPPLMDAFTAGWRPVRPWIFGEYCDADTIRDVRGRSDWYLLDDPRANPISANHGGAWRTAFPAMFGGAANLPPETLARLDALPGLSYRHALIHRKATVEATRCYPEISGYVLTSIRDCPLATSGLYDDEGRLKFDPEQLRAFNGPRVLALMAPLAAPWRAGGNQLDTPDAYNGFAGERAQWFPVLSNQGEALEGCRLRWSFTGVESGQAGGCALPIIGAGEVVRLSLLELTWPQPGRCTLTLELLDGADRRLCANQWVLGSHRRPRGTGVAVYDPNGLLPGWSAALPEAVPLSEADSGCMVIATCWDERLQRLVRQGGRAVYLQRTAAGLPVESLPFWRECCPVLADHPVVRALDLAPGDTCDLPFYALATPMAFCPEALERMLEARVSPILERFDARTYARHLYAWEAHLGAGRVIGATLSVAGGEGRQPLSLRANAGGLAFLDACLRALAAE